MNRIEAISRQVMHRPVLRVPPSVKKPEVTVVKVPRSMGVKVASFLQETSLGFEKPSTRMFQKLQSELTVLDDLSFDINSRNVIFVKAFFDRLFDSIPNLPNSAQESASSFLAQFQEKIATVQPEQRQYQSRVGLLLEALDIMDGLPLPNRFYDDPNPKISQVLTQIKTVMKDPLQGDNIKLLKDYIIDFLLTFDASTSDLESAAFIWAGIDLLVTAATGNPRFSAVIDALEILLNQSQFTRLTSDDAVIEARSMIIEVLDHETPGIDLDATLIDTVDDKLDIEDSSSDADDIGQDNDVLEAIKELHDKAVEIRMQSMRGARPVYNDKTDTFYMAASPVARLVSPIKELRFFSGFGTTPVLGIGCENGRVLFLQMSNQKRLKQLIGFQIDQEKDVYSSGVIATSYDGNVVAVATSSHVAVIKNGRFQFNISLKKQRIYDVELFQGRLYVAAGNDICIWDIHSEKAQGVLIGHAEPVLSISSKGQYLISGSIDDTIRIWDIKTQKTVKQLKGHGADVSALVINENNVLISGDQNGNIRTWNGAYRSMALMHQGYIQDLSMKGSYVASCATDHGIRIWNFKKNQLLYQIKEEAECIHLFKDHLNNPYLMTASKTGLVRLWRLRPQAPLLKREYAILIS